MLQPVEKSRGVTGEDDNSPIEQGLEFGAGGRTFRREAGIGGSCGRTWDSTNVGHAAGFVATPTTTKSSRC